MADKKKTPPPPFPAVQLVSLWALLTAGVFIAAFALAYALLPPLSWTRLMTDHAEVAAYIGRGVAWCTAAQSATTALALLLRGSSSRLCRRALAYAALVAAAASHATFWFWINLVVASARDDPGRVGVAFWLWIIGGCASFAMLAAGDHMCFLALTGSLERAMVPI